MPPPITPTPVDAHLSASTSPSSRAESDPVASNGRHSISLHPSLESEISEALTVGTNPASSLLSEQIPTPSQIIANSHNRTRAVLDSLEELRDTLANRVQQLAESVQRLRQQARLLEANMEDGSRQLRRGSEVIHLGWEGQGDEGDISRPIPVHTSSSPSRTGYTPLATNVSGSTPRPTSMMNPGNSRLSFPIPSARLESLLDQAVADTRPPSSFATDVSGPVARPTSSTNPSNSQRPPRIPSARLESLAQPPPTITSRTPEWGPNARPDEGIANVETTLNALRAARESITRSMDVDDRRNIRRNASALSNPSSSLPQRSSWDVDDESSQRAGRRGLLDGPVNAPLQVRFGGRAQTSRSSNSDHNSTVADNANLNLQSLRSNARNLHRHRIATIAQQFLDSESPATPSSSQSRSSLRETDVADGNRNRIRLNRKGRDESSAPPGLPATNVAAQQNSRAPIIVRSARPSPMVTHSDLPRVSVELSVDRSVISSSQDRTGSGASDSVTSFSDSFVIPASSSAESARTASGTESALGSGSFSSAVSRDARTETTRTSAGSPSEGTDDNRGAMTRRGLRVMERLQGTDRANASSRTASLQSSTSSRLGPIGNGPFIVPPRRADEPDTSSDEVGFGSSGAWRPDTAAYIAAQREVSIARDARLRAQEDFHAIMHATRPIVSPGSSSATGTSVPRLSNSTMPTLDPAVSGVLQRHARDALIHAQVRESQAISTRDWVRSPLREISTEPIVGQAVAGAGEQDQRLRIRPVTVDSRQWETTEGQIRQMADLESQLDVIRAELVDSARRDDGTPGRSSDRHIETARPYPSESVVSQLRRGVDPAIIISNMSALSRDRERERSRGSILDRRAAMPRLSVAVRRGANADPDFAPVTRRSVTHVPNINIIRPAFGELDDTAEAESDQAMLDRLERMSDDTPNVDTYVGSDQGAHGMEMAPSTPITLDSMRSHQSRNRGRIIAVDPTSDEFQAIREAMDDIYDNNGHDEVEHDHDENDGERDSDESTSEEEDSGDDISSVDSSTASEATWNPLPPPRIDAPLIGQVDFDEPGEAHRCEEDQGSGISVTELGDLEAEEWAAGVCGTELYVPNARRRVVRPYISLIDL